MLPEDAFHVCEEIVAGYELRKKSHEEFQHLVYGASRLCAPLTNVGMVTGVAVPWKRDNLPTPRLRVYEDTSTRQKTKDWRELPRMHGIVAEGQLWDPTGKLWCRSAHVPLILGVGVTR